MAHVCPGKPFQMATFCATIARELQHRVARRHPRLTAAAVLATAGAPTLVFYPTGLTGMSFVTGKQIVRMRAGERWPSGMYRDPADSTSVPPSETNLSSSFQAASVNLIGRNVAHDHEIDFSKRRSRKVIRVRRKFQRSRKVRFRQSTPRDRAVRTRLVFKSIAVIAAERRRVEIAKFPAEPRRPPAALWHGRRRRSTKTNGDCCRRAFRLLEPEFSRRRSCGRFPSYRDRTRQSPKLPSHFTVWRIGSASGSSCRHQFDIDRLACETNCKLNASP